MTTTVQFRRFARLAAVGLLAVAPVGLAACGGDESASTSTTAASGETTTTVAATGAPSVSDPWVRAAAVGGNSAAYMTISGGTEADALVGASLPDGVAGEVQLHETTTTDGDMNGDMAGDMAGDMGDGGGMMGMVQVNEIPIPAGGSVSLEPGGFHIMLIDLTSELTAGATLPITLTFASGATETVEAEVRAG